MLRSHLGIRIFAVLVLLVGALNFFIGTSNPLNAAFLIIGFACVLLGIGIFNLWNWTRVTMLVFSFAFILLVYIPVTIGTVLGHLQYAGFVGLIAHFPLLILSLLCIDSFMRPEVKGQFKKQRNSGDTRLNSRS